MAAVCLGDKWGYINNKGELIIDPVFDYACDFNNGLARFNVGSNWLSRGTSTPKGGLWGFIDKSGEVKILPTLTAVSDFEGDYAQLIEGDNNNYINKKGEILFK